MPQEMQSIPTWGWVIAICGAAVATTYAIKQALVVYFEYRDRQTKQRRVDQMADAQHQTELLEIEDKKNARLYKMLADLGVEAIEARRERQACIDEHSKCREAVARLEERVSILEEK